MSYEIRNGKIQTRQCEVDPVHQCNLSCRGCNHLAPRARPYIVDPKEVLCDLSILARYYHTESFCLAGGEPLLHPHLLDVIEAVRQSCISERIRVFTNGILLRRMPDEFWQNLGDVQIRLSVYPGTIQARELQAAQQRARVQGVDLSPVFYHSFREAYSELGTSDARLVSRIFSTCLYTHFRHCHIACDGYFYRCGHSVFITRYLLGISGPDEVRDGVKIEDSPSLGDDLLDYLLSEEPLAACQYCLGSVGKQIRHEQQPRRVTGTPRSTEELVDWKRLEQLENSDDLVAPPYPQRLRKLFGFLPPAVLVHPVVWRLKAALRNTIF